MIAPACIAACILLPLILAAATPFLPHSRLIGPAVALLNFALAGSLPWLGDGDWLAVHVAILTGFAWLMASGAAALEGPEQPGAPVAALVGCANLALLGGNPVLTVLAAGAGAFAAIQALRPTAPGQLRTAAASASGLAVFGTALLSNGPPTASLGSVFVLLGLGCVCLLAPMWAMLHGVALPRGLAMLAGPFGGVWVATAMRLDSLTPGISLAAGIALVLDLGRLPVAQAVCRAALRRDRRVPGHRGRSVCGAGAAPTGLLHLTLGCLALTAALTSGWPAVLGLAALAGVPPLGVFASFFDLLTGTASRSIPLALSFAAAMLVFLLAALRHLPRTLPTTPAAQLGWLGLALALGGGWLLPPGIAAWLQGIAAAAR